MTKNKKIIFHASAQDFEKIPGAPVAYWMSKKMTALFATGTLLSDIASVCQGMKTANNNLFLRYWYEIDITKSFFNAHTADEANASLKKWFPYNKGGEFRKWYGNQEYLINWYQNGKDVKSYEKAVIRNETFYFKESLTWSLISSSNLGIRYSPSGFIFDGNGSSMFCSLSKTSVLLGFLCSKTVKSFLQILSPTMSFEIGQLSKLPIHFTNELLQEASKISTECIWGGKKDWDRYETSWDFQRNPLIGCSQPVSGLDGNAQPARDALAASLADAYTRCREEWARDTVEMHRLEEENNRIFIDAYGLQDELTPDVPWNEITLTCNPWYRYGVKVESGQRAVDSEKMPQNEELERRLLADTIKEFISYAVGCMMGRYSLDKPGLVLANQGDTLADYYRIVASGQGAVDRREVTSDQSSVPSENANALTTDHCPLPTQKSDHRPLTTVHFSPDEDGIIPILDEDWFDDDIVTRFNEFLKVTYGEDSFHENLAFIEEGLGKDLRSYFTKDFYKDHLQRYHNRPIYWLFSSPKGAFSALVYMHRYRPETAGIVLTYLRSHITKVTERIHNLDVTIDSADSTAGMKSKAIRERSKLQKNLQEMEDYERDVLYPLSTEKIAIDLDDGVKVNYQKFGKALRKVTGLDAKEE